MNHRHTRLKNLLSITPEGYETVYMPLFFHLSRWIEKNAVDLSSKAKANRLHTIWCYSTDALKLRRGYLLPFDSDAETCYREQDVWSYAVFTAALLDSLMKHFHPSVPHLIDAILPASGLAWLKAYASVFKAWNSYLQENDKKTVFYAIEKQWKQSRRHSATTQGTKNAEVSVTST